MNTPLRLLILLAALSAPDVAMSASDPKDRLDLPCTWPVDEPEKATQLCRAIYHLGRYDEARPGPTIHGRPTIEVTIQPEWGFNFLERSVALLQEDNRGVHVLWLHPSYYASNFPPTHKYNQTIVRWRYAPGGRTIYVSGTTATGPLRVDGTAKWKKRRSLPLETYRYSERTHKFEVVGRHSAHPHAATSASDQFNEMEQSGKVEKSYQSGTAKAYRTPSH